MSHIRALSLIVLLIGTLTAVSGCATCGSGCSADHCEGGACSKAA